LSAKKIAAARDSGVDLDLDGAVCGDRLRRGDLGLVTLFTKLVHLF
jgi:hypothetical protein